MEKNESIFEKLNKIDVSGKTEKKNGLTYLSWAWAWGELKKVCPNARYTIYENKDGWNYFTDGRTAWVKTGVEVEGIEYIEYLPIMDARNKSIPLGNITSFEVNKTIQRSLTKAVARHGLGLYIYAGEDTCEGNNASEATETASAPKAEKPKPKPKPKPARTYEPKPDEGICEVCGKVVDPQTTRRSKEACQGHVFCCPDHMMKWMAERKAK